MPDIKKIEKQIMSHHIKKLGIIGLSIVSRITKRVQIDNLNVYLRPLGTYDNSYYNGTAISPKGTQSVKVSSVKTSRKVNLTWSGKMLNSIDSKNTAKGIKIFFNTNDADILKRAKANQKKYDFFGVDKKTLKYITKQLDK